MPRKRPQVLGGDLNPSESSCPAATVCPASHRDRVLLERAADPLHRARVNSKPFGNDADTGPPRSRQSLTDSLFQCRGDWGTPKAFTLTPGPRKASMTTRSRCLMTFIADMWVPADAQTWLLRQRRSCLAAP
jgi:hypothetical protein